MAARARKTATAGPIRSENTTCGSVAPVTATGSVRRNDAVNREREIVAGGQHVHRLRGQQHADHDVECPEPTVTCPVSGAPDSTGPLSTAMAASKRPAITIR